MNHTVAMCHLERLPSNIALGYAFNLIIHDILKHILTIADAMKKTIKNVTEAEVEGIVREWLRTASDREGGRKRRREATRDNRT
jgi:hypothetical protein